MSVIATNPGPGAAAPGLNETPELPATQVAAAGKAVPAQAAGRGIAFMLLAVGLFAIMDALVKWLSDSYPTVQLIFFRSLFAFVPLAIFVVRDGLASMLKVQDRQGHVIRCLVGTVAMGAFFYAFGRMPLADVIAITFAAPLFVTALSVPLLGERVGPRRWTAVLVGFAGVLIMVRPSAGVFEPIALLALFGTVFYALAAVFVRRLARTETSASIVFYFTLSTTLVSALLLPFQWVTPSPPHLALLIGIGLIGGLAQIAMTTAFRHADVSVIVPFEYSAMLWAAFLGFFIWGEVPGNNIWFGVAIVMTSGLYILFREANLGLPRGIARKLHTRR